LIRSPIRFLLSAALLLSACTLQPNVANVAPNGHVGSAAPTLSGSALEGGALKVDFHQAKTVVVFWAAWCGPCRHEQPGLNNLAAEFGAQGIRFYGVDMLDHDKALARAFVGEFKVSYPSLYDDAGAVAAAYEVDSPPSFVLVDQRGVVVARYPGEASEAQLRTLIEQKFLT
jgi:thiol-disulfide isomerase/thioredoxin